MIFQYDPHKEQLNIEKHGFDFTEAQEVFADVHAVLEYRTNSPASELRYRLTGAMHDGTILSVVYTQRPNAIRIISARPAHKAERSLYEKRKNQSKQ